MEYRLLGSLVKRKIGYGIVQSGQSTGNGVPIIKVNNIISGLESINDLDTTSHEISEKYSRTILRGGELIVSVVGTIGKTAIVPENFAGCNLVRAVALLDIEDKIISKWVKYYLDSPYGKDYISQNLNTTVQPTLNIKSLTNMPIPFYDTEYIEKTIDLLSEIDDKIALNNKINENLEQQARLTLNWWMGEHSREYKSLPLSDIATVNDSVYSPKEQWHFVNYLDTSSITDGIITELQHIVPAIDKLPSRARRKIVTNDIVFSTVRPNQHHFGIIKQPVSNMLVSTGFAVIRSKTKEICNELIYLRLTEDSFIESMQQIAEQSTSTFPSIKPSDLYQCEIPCPIDDKLTILLENVFSIIAINQKENLGLSQLRDALLPKLMNGEIEL